MRRDEMAKATVTATGAALNTISILGGLPSE